MKLRHLLLPLSAFLVGPLFAVQLTERQSGHIAHLVGNILSFNHLRQEAFNDDLSKLSLDNYLNNLDVHHHVFLKADVEEFRSKYATKLDDLTLGPTRWKGDASPAFEIFQRYLVRLEERIQKIDTLLEAAHDFQADETLDLDRSEKSWPATPEEADELWRKRIKADLLQGRLEEEPLEDVKKRLAGRYAWLLKDWKSLEPDEILQIYLTAIGQAYDPHSAYLCPSEMEDFEIHNIKLELTGIGALLRSEHGYCKIAELVPGGPAERSGQIKPKDIIIKVAQADGDPEDVVGMRLRKVVDKIRGTKDTEVRLTIRPADGSKTKVVSLIRDVIKLKDRQAHAKIIQQPGNRAPHKLAVIELPQYYKHSASDIQQILTRLKREKADGIILDLRYNGGGILDQAVKLTGLFFPKGPVVQVRDFRNQVDLHFDPDPQTIYDGPLAVLVSRQSASASEITAAALQDYGRALIIGGQATHGKGTVQTLLPLTPASLRNRAGAQPKNSGQLKFTFQNFYRVTGTPTQKDGVKPDIILPSIFDYMDIGEEHLPNSLALDEIKPTKYNRLNRVAPYLKNLKEQSQNRVRQDQDFAYVREDIKRFREIKKNQALSLNENTRIAEMEQEETRKEARKQERQNRTAPQESVLLLTLDAAKEDGPLTLLPYLAADKPKENPTPKPETQNAEAIETEDKNSGRRFDPHLREALNILTDYIQAIETSPPNPSAPNLPDDNPSPKEPEPQNPLQSSASPRHTEPNPIVTLKKSA